MENDIAVASYDKNFVDSLCQAFFFLDNYIFVVDGMLILEIKLFVNHDIVTFFSRCTIIVILMGGKIVFYVHEVQCLIKRFLSVIGGTTLTVKARKIIID